jgi:hypothetical protein
MRQRTQRTQPIQSHSNTYPPLHSGFPQTSTMPLAKLGDYRYLNGRRVVSGLHPALVGHVAKRWLPHDVRLTKQQLNACAPFYTHGNAPRTQPLYR